MKTNKLIAILALFLALGSGLQAQNSSFMGRRVLFNLTTNFSPAWGNPNFFDSDHWEKYYAFNFDLSPGIEIIAWKKGTVGANYHWFKTKFDYPVYQPQNDPNYSDFWGYYIADVADLNVHGFGVYYKQYIGRKARAPIGTYWRFQFDGFFYSAPALQLTGNLFAFKAEFGHDFLFFDRLRVSAGFSFGIPFCAWKKLGYNYSGSNPFMILAGASSAFYDDSATVNDYINARLFGHYYIGFVLSVGVLAF